MIQAHRRLGGSLASVDVAAMSNTEHDDLAAFVIDAVENSVGTAASTPHAFQLVSECGSDSARVLQEGAGDEVDHREGDRFREYLPDRSRCRSGHDDLVSRFGHWGRRALTASTPRTTSPSR